MKTLSTTLLAVTLTVFIGTTARAGGIPVIDVAHIVESVQQLIQMKEAFEKQKQELEEAVKQVEALTGDRGIGDLLNGSTYRDARRYAPTTWQDTMRILEAGGLPGSATDVRDIYEAHSDQYQIANRDAYNVVNPDAPNATAFERRRDTTRASLAVSEASYDKTLQRNINYESFMKEIKEAPDMKAIGDLTARINAENGTALAELIRLNAVQMQHAGSIQTQIQVDETNMKRQTSYKDYPFGELPTE